MTYDQGLYCIQDFCQKKKKSTPDTPFIENELIHPVGKDGIVY